MAKVSTTILLNSPPTDHRPPLIEREFYLSIYSRRIAKLPWFSFSCFLFLVLLEFQIASHEKRDPFDLNVASKSQK